MNKTFPNGVKATSKGIGKSWRKMGGKVCWPHDMKLFLVNRVKEHVSVLENTRNIDQNQKDRVWDQIYKALVRRGMPDTDVNTLRNMWVSMRSSTVELCRRMETKRSKRRSISPPLTDLQLAIREVIELGNKLKNSGSSMMPAPMRIKAEPVDEAAEDVPENDMTPSSSTSMNMNETQREEQALQLRSQCAVILRPLNIAANAGATISVDSSNNVSVNGAKIVTPPTAIPTPPPSIGDVASSSTAQPSSANAGTSSATARPSRASLETKLVEAELKLKLVQVQKEEQSLEFERQMHTRQLAILDADLRKRNIEIRSLLQPSQQNDENTA